MTRGTVQVSIATYPPISYTIVVEKYENNTDTILVQQKQHSRQANCRPILAAIGPQLAWDEMFAGRQNALTNTNKLYIFTGNSQL